MTRLPLSRRSVLGGLSASAVIGIPPAPAIAAAPALDFLAIGDWGRDGTSHQRDVAAAMGRVVDAVGSRFTVAVGYNFYENGVQSAHDPQWRSSFEEVYTARSLQRRWYALLGNHDYRGNPQAQIDYSRRGSRWRMPARYYKVAGAPSGMPSVDLFMLDTSPLVHMYRINVFNPVWNNVRTQDVERQLAWLDHELAASKAGWKLVFGHHTIFSGGSMHGNTAELVEKVKPILERHGVRVYINGHDHDMQHIEINGVNYITTGAGSEVRPTCALPGTKFCLSRSGFAQFRLHDDTMRLAFRDYTGAIVYDADISRSAGLWAGTA